MFRQEGGREAERVRGNQGKLPIFRYSLPKTFVSDERAQLTEQH